SLQVTFFGHQTVAGQGLADSANHLRGETGSGVKPGRWGALRCGTVGKEVVHRLVGVGKRVALRQAADDSEDFVDTGRQSLRQFLRLLQASRAEVFDQLMKLEPETIGRAQKETVVRPFGRPEPADVIAFGAAHEK